MKYIIILLILAISYGSSAKLSGQARIDSLEAELPNAKADTNHVNLLHRLSFAYYTINPDKGIEYGEKGLALANDINWKQGEAASYNNLAINYSIKSDYPKALEFWDSALSINKELDNIKGIAANLGNIGGCS
ncbi:tetratricopeptide repeat protein [Candidatus Kapabacteria bacterium]|nr:tetratricopeptide repeat protein [Candidatus Kapabacteria bacterium]